MAHKSKTNSRSITKIRMRVTHDTCYIAHQFQGQKGKGQVHRPTNADTQNVPYFPNGKDFKVAVRMEDVEPQRLVPWPSRLKIKVKRLHGMSDPCGSYYEMCTWCSDNQRRVWLTIAVTSKVNGQGHKLAHIVCSCTSHLCLFLIRETKCCTGVIRGGRGIPCLPNPAATLLDIHTLYHYDHGRLTTLYLYNINTV